MKTIVTFVALATLTFSIQYLTAQEVAKTSESTADSQRIQQLLDQKELIIQKEKNLLKKEVGDINERLANEEITIEEAQELKKDAATLHALNIENRMAIIDNKIALMKRNQIEYVNEDPQSKIEIGINAENDQTGDQLFGLNVNTGKEKKIKYDKRTQSGPMLAIGFNNALSENGSIDDLDYKIAGSRFFELGWLWSTRVFKETNFMRINYGISYMSNGLKPTDNRYFVVNDDQTTLEEFEFDLDKSKFRMDQLVMPLYFEFGPYKVDKNEERIRYRTTGKFKIGVGGYAGVAINTVQKLKYKKDGDEIKDKIKQDFNTNNLIYGLGGYIGFGDTSLYVKYDLSPLFENTEVDQNNISLGLRWDL